MSERGSISSKAAIGVTVGLIGGSLWWGLSQHREQSGSWRYVVQCPEAYHPDPKVQIVTEQDDGHLLRFACIPNDSKSQDTPQSPNDIWPLHRPQESLYGDADPSYGTVWQATIDYTRSTGLTTFGGHPRVVLDTDPHSPRPQEAVLEVSAIGRLGIYHNFAVKTVIFKQLPN